MELQAYKPYNVICICKFILKLQNIFNVRICHVDFVYRPLWPQNCVLYDSELFILIYSFLGGGGLMLLFSFFVIWIDERMNTHSVCSKFVRYNLKS
jgi:hypothetical protein